MQDEGQKRNDHLSPAFKCARQEIMGRKNHETDLRRFAFIKKRAVPHFEGTFGMTISVEAKTRPRVMVVGNDTLVARALTMLLSADDSIAVLAPTAWPDMATLQDLQPDLILLDEGAVPAHGAKARAYIERAAPRTKVVALQSLDTMTLSELLSFVKTSSRRTEPPHKPHASASTALAALSEREIEVVRLVAEGLSNKEISSRLSLSDKTVKNHISHILAKMSLTARTQVAVCAIRAGLV